MTSYSEKGQLQFGTNYGFSTPGSTTIPAFAPPSYSEVVDANAPGAPGTSSVMIRNLRNTSDECDFASKLVVEAFRVKFVHATSEGSLQNVIHSLSLDFQVQTSVFYERRFVAEFYGERAGFLTLEFNGDPKPIPVREHYQTLGCTDQCGLGCLGSVARNEQVPWGKCHIACISVDERFRGKGTGKIMLERAEYEARKRGCKVIYLWVRTDNRAMNLFQRQGYKVTERIGNCFLWCILGVREVVRMEKNI